MEVIMNATQTSTVVAADHRHSLSVVRLIVAGGVTAAGVFVLCWLGTFVPFSSPTHAYISLFTPADIGSVQALIEGGVWSLLFGAFVGAVFAVTYNATSSLGRG
jgi:hypothetical protein